jgi:hypothetical protein
LDHLVVILTLSMLPASAGASVARITLKELVDDSDLIVVARETKIEDGPADLNLGKEVSSPIKVATARIVEVWKGKAGPDVRYIASPTWTCDISEAKVGEPVVLFLSKSKSVPFMRIEHSGRGRMPIRDVNGKRHATIWVIDIELPRGVKTIPGPESEYQFIRSVAVDDLKHAVRQVVRDSDTKRNVAVTVTSASPSTFPSLPKK